MAENIKEFKNKMTAITFSNGISKISENKMQESNLDLIINKINNQELDTDIIKAIISDDVMPFEKRAICKTIEKSDISIFEMYLTAKKEIEININDLYKAKPYLSKENAEQLKNDIVLHKVFHDEPIFAGETYDVEKPIPDIQTNELDNADNTDKTEEIKKSDEIEL